MTRGSNIAEEHGWFNNKMQRVPVESNDLVRAGDSHRHHEHTRTKVCALKLKRRLPPQSELSYGDLVVFKAVAR
jgi:hypothetical protein